MPGPIIRPKVSSTIGSDDHLKKLKAVLDASRGAYVTVGILQPNVKYPDSDATVGQVAAWQEFGTHGKDGSPIVPARSFIRTPTDKALSKLAALKQRELDLIVQEKSTIRQGLARLGADLQRRMQNAIVQNIPPPLTPETLAKKRALGQPDTPLIATGLLKASIGFAVFVDGKRVTPFKPPARDLSAAASKLNEKAKGRAASLQERRAKRRAELREADRIKADHAQQKKDFGRARKSMAKRQRAQARAERLSKTKKDKREAKKQHKAARKIVKQVARDARREKRVATQKARRDKKREAKQQRKDFARARAAVKRRARSEEKHQAKTHTRKQQKALKAEKKRINRMVRAERKQQRKDFRRARKSFAKRSGPRQNKPKG